MEAFVYETVTPRVVFAGGAGRTQLPSEIAKIGRRVHVIVSEPERDLAKSLTEAIEHSVVGIFTDVRQHVPEESVEAVLAEVAASGADVVLSIGGGSTTGTAKAVALHTSLPIVAVPTTYAGSEMTPIWGTTAAGRKTTGRSMAVVPRTVVYDPDLTVSLPLGITVASALNAVAHCVESIYAAGSNPITTAVAVEGVRALAGGLPAVTADLLDAAGRWDLLYGAFLAGTAFAVAGSGLHHRICHVLGGAFDLPHAETHAIVLPHVTAFNEPAVPQMWRVAAALSAPTAAEGLRRLGDAVGAPRALADIGLPVEGIEVAVSELAQKDFSDNPRPMSENDVRGIITAAFYGSPPSVSSALA